MAIRLDKALATWWNAQDIRFKDTSGRFVGAPIGISALDSIDKLRHPFYGVIIARNKAGKTAFMLTIAIAMARSGMVILFNSLEMNLYQMCGRLAANVSRVDMNQYEHLRATRAEWERTQKALEELSRYDFYFTEGKNTAKKLQHEMDGIKAKYPNRKILVITDYGQLMTEEEDRGIYRIQTELSAWMKSQTLSPNYSEEELTAEMMLGLTGDCFSMLTCAQVIVSAKRSGEKVTDASASGTGAWGNDADIWWLINDVIVNKEPLPNVRDVTMGGRFTGGGIGRIMFTREQARFEDYVEPSAVTEPPM
jgi:hypothetical protein